MLGKNLRNLRIKKGLSINELANMAKVSKSYISYIERGIKTSPSPHIITRLANILETNVENLYKPTDDNGEIDIEWIELLEEGVRAGMSKEQFKVFIDFIKYKQVKSV